MSDSPGCHIVQGPSIFLKQALFKYCFSYCTVHFATAWYSL